MSDLGKNIMQATTGYWIRRITAIENDLRLTYEHESDARYVWPTRWESLKSEMFLHAGNR